MRIAIIADIHGNCVALDAVMDDLQRHPADSVVCLGDAIQGGAQPTETVERLRALGCPIVMGNADDWLLTAQNTGSEGVSAQQQIMREWSLAQLAPEDIAFIRSFRPVVEMPLDSSRHLLCFHGSPGSYDDIILPETPREEVERLLMPSTPALLTGGHTHLQQIHQLGESFFFNPGSVGVVYERHLPPPEVHLYPWAEYAVLTTEEQTTALEFRRIRYDVELVIEAIRRSGRPNMAGAVAEFRV